MARKKAKDSHSVEKTSDKESKKDLNENPKNDSDNKSDKDSTKTATSERSKTVKAANATAPTKKRSGWSRDFVSMTTAQRYVYLGVMVCLIVMLCFFACLAIDKMMNQEAKFAYVGIFAGSLLACYFAFTKLKTLVNADAPTLKKSEKRPKRRDRKIGKDGLSNIERDILAREKASAILNEANHPHPHKSERGHRHGHEDHEESDKAAED